MLYERFGVLWHLGRVYYRVSHFYYEFHFFLEILIGRCEGSSNLSLDSLRIHSPDSAITFPPSVRPSLMLMP